MERKLTIGPDFCALEEDGMLVEFIRLDPTQQCGDILGGKVERMMPGIGSAFVDIGRKTRGFLPLKENSLTFAGQPVKSGMKIPVQIRKEETGGKGACLSRDLTLAGKYILLMPMNRYIGVSNRIANENEREKLRQEGREIAGGSMGIVMREASLHAEREQIEAEAQELRRCWESAEERIRSGFEAGEILIRQDPLAMMIDDYESRGIAGKAEAETLSDGLKRQLQHAGERKVRIPNGGNIVIDRCEAMTVIDVNSGSAGAGGKTGSAYLETNLSACETIAAQIRLRNLSGMILIDFIDMENDEERERVAEKLREMLSRDRRKTVIHGWTRLGILEMTRKRTGA